MHPDLSQLLEPLSLARAGESLKGQFSLKEFHRLETLVNDDQGGLVYQLDFSVDTNSICFIRGEIKASVSVLCQRCLEPMQLEITHLVSLGIVRDLAEAKELPAKYEPLTLTEETLSLTELVENELILALPFSPMHIPGDCPMSDILDKFGDNRIRTPFAALAEFKKCRTTCSTL